jgi:hypothetical protein
MFVRPRQSTIRTSIKLGKGAHMHVYLPVAILFVDIVDMLVEGEAK